MSATNKDVSTRFEGIAQDIAAIATRVLETERGAMEQSTGVDQCVKAMNELDLVANKTQTITQTINEVSGKIQLTKDQVASSVQSTTAVVFGSATSAPEVRVVIPEYRETETIRTESHSGSIEDIAESSCWSG